MKETIRVEMAEPISFTVADIVYDQRIENGGIKYYPMHITINYPREYVFCARPDDVRFPVFAFLCGGGWTMVDHNAWTAELGWYAKNGYATASIEYPITSSVRYPENLVAVKNGIRYLRAHADELGLDTEHIILGGESAGGYLALMAAATQGDPRYAKGNNVDFSDEVSGVISYYAPDAPVTCFKPDLLTVCGLDGTVPSDFPLPIDSYKYPRVTDTITTEMPPTYLIQGLNDELVDWHNADMIYETLQRAGIRSDLTLVEGANHADGSLFQQCIKKKVLAFMDEVTGK